MKWNPLVGRFPESIKLRPFPSSWTSGATPASILAAIRFFVRRLV